MLGSPSTFLPRTLFSEDDADSVAETDVQTEGGWEMAKEAMTGAQRPLLHPSDSFSSDDEDGPLHWSSFHSQIEALLKTVQKPAPDRDSNAAQDGPLQEDRHASCSSAASDCGASKGAGSDSSAAELLAFMTGDTASSAAPAPEAANKQQAHSEVYGRPLPSWLFELATTADGSGGISGTPSKGPTTVHACAATPCAAAGAQVRMEVQEEHFEGGLSDSQQVNLGQAEQHKQVAPPEWLTSPAQPAASSLCASRQLPEAVSHTPFKSLIEEIEANLAAGDASKASTAFLYSDCAAPEGLQWFTNELARAAADAQQNDQPFSFQDCRLDENTGEEYDNAQATGGFPETSPFSKVLPLFQEEMAELDPLADGAILQEISAQLAVPGSLEAPPCLQPAFGSPTEAAHLFDLGDAEQEGLHGTPSHMSEMSNMHSPVHQQENSSPVRSYRILRPSISPRSIMQQQQQRPPGWTTGFLEGQPASQEKFDAELCKPESSESDRNSTPVVYMHGGRRVLGELYSNSPVGRGSILAKDDAPAAGIPSPETSVFVDKDGVSIGARSRPVVDDRLGAVYAQIDALSRDLRGTHDELEQLRLAEAQLKGIYEGLAQQEACPPRATQSSVGAVPPEWARHITPQQVVELEEARQVLAARLQVLAAAQADKDARLAHVTAELREARQQLAAKQREADVLLGESLGLQDILMEAGSEAAAATAHLSELEAQLAHSQARVEEVELQLAEREAELAQCREQLQRTEQLLNKARNAAALAPVPKKSSSTPAAVAAAVPAPPQEITAKPDGKLSSTAGEVDGDRRPRSRPSSAEELSRAMVTPPVAERRIPLRAASVGLTPPFTPSTDPAHRPALAFHSGKSPVWAAATPALARYSALPAAAKRPGSAARSAWDLPSPLPKSTPSASSAALASVLRAIRERESVDGSEREKEVRSQQPCLPETPLASLLCRMNSGRNSMDCAAVL